MTGRKSLAERVRERARAIHRGNRADCEYDEPTQAELEQATREVMRSERGRP